MEIAVIWPTLAPHVTGCPSVWLRGEPPCLCVIVAVCHTPLHTPDPLSHDLKTLLQPHPPLCANYTLRIMLPCSNFAVVLGLLQVLRITADIGTYPWHFFFLSIQLGCWVKTLWNSHMSCAVEAVLFCSRQWLLPDLQWQPQQVHKGGECHLDYGGPLRSSCQRAAVSLGLWITHPQSQAEALSGGHRD